VARTAGIVRFSVVNAAGQYVVGLLLTWLVLAPLFGTPALMACLIEVGFSGGHGTASAMASVFTDLGFPAGGALGQMSATVGLVTGVIGGVILIQWGARRGHASQVAAGMPRSAGRFGPPAARGAPIVATGTVSAVAIRAAHAHTAVIGLAILLGWTLQTALQALHPAFNGFPLFPLAMIGGMAIQVVADRTGIAAWFDRATFQRLTGLALDLLVAAAVASMRLDLFVQNVVPFTLLMVVAIAWCVGSFLWIAPRMLPRDWFEQGLVVCGTQTGVAAVGLMLLRIAVRRTTPPRRRPSRRGRS
jgi:ESS family glutamate:Na+ symporter